MNALIREFADDSGVRLIAALILLDLVLGVAAAVNSGPGLGSFRLVWLTDFLRADVLGKVVPYFAVWAAVRLAGDIEISGLGLIEEGVGGAVVLALGASVLNSIRDLGLGKKMPNAIAGPDQPPQT